MGAAEIVKKISGDEYLALERKASEKSEFYNGEVFAMAGASLNHNLICKNIISFLDSKLKGKNCNPVGSDMRLHIPSKKFYTYPDISVYCGKPELLDGQFDTLLNPTFIAEVGSPSTFLYDVDKRFDFYRSIPSLKEYWAISSFEYRLQKFVRNVKDNSWLLTETTNTEETVSLSSFDLFVPLTEIYRDIVFQ
jgi:Uma2 family endonuclease